MQKGDFMTSKFTNEYQTLYWALDVLINSESLSSQTKKELSEFRAVIKKILHEEGVIQ